MDKICLVFLMPHRYLKTNKQANRFYLYLPGVLKLFPKRRLVFPLLRGLKSFFTKIFSYSTFPAT